MYYRRRLLVQLFVVLLSLLSVSSVYARGAVNGKYLQNHGREIVLELTIGAPAPANLILKQQLPSGTGIVQAIPPVKKYTAATGKAHWLFTDLQPGTMTIRLLLAKPLQGTPPVAEVRCKDPETGKYVTTRIP